MNNLVQILNNKATTTSLKVANYFGKEHKNVLRAIEEILEDNGSIASLNFELCEYEAKSQGISRKYPMYNIDKNGFTLLAMGFTGKKAMQFKINYIQAFNEMEKQLAQPKQLTRKEMAQFWLEAEQKNELLEKENKAQRKVIEDQNELNVSLINLKATKTRTALKAVKDDVGVEINLYIAKLFASIESFPARHRAGRELYQRMTGKYYPGASKASLDSKKDYLTFLKEQASKLEL